MPILSATQHRWEQAGRMVEDSLRRQAECGRGWQRLWTTPCAYVPLWCRFLDTHPSLPLTLGEDGWLWRTDPGQRMREIVDLWEQWASEQGLVDARGDVCARRVV